MLFQPLNTTKQLLHTNVSKLQTFIQPTHTHLSLHLNKIQNKIAIKQIKIAMKYFVYQNITNYISLQAKMQNVTLNI